MHILVHGKQIEVGAALRSQTESKLSSAVDKYFDGDASCTVTFSRANHSFQCDCLVHLATGLTLATSGVAADAHVALDAAVERLEKRLRRYKRRLKDHHGKTADDTPVESVTAQAYVIEDTEAGEEPASLDPMIIAELTTELLALTVGEAVMRMNLAELPALMFQNRGTGRLNMVYRRHDGNIGWIDPRLRQQQ